MNGQERSETAVPPEWFRRLVTGCVLAGLCPPLPIPFFEDWGRNLLRKRIVRTLAVEFGVSLNARQTKTLAGGVGEGCLYGCLWGGIHLLTFPWRIIRVLLYVISVRRRLAEVSDLFHRFYLIRYAFETGALQAAMREGERDTTGRIGRAAERACRETDTRFFDEVFQRAVSSGGSWVRRTTREIGKAVLRVWKKRKQETEADRQKEAEAVEDQLATSVPPSLMAELWQKRERLRPLQDRFDELFREGV